MTDLWKCDDCHLSWPFETKHCPDCTGDRDSLRDKLATLEAANRELRAEVERPKSAPGYTITFERVGDTVIASHVETNCIGAGATVPEALSEFCEMFEVQWASLVECPETELTAGAMRVRETFLALAPEPAGGKQG